ncbi:hypothetical protein ACFSHR_09780 [Azotobacter chroococcum]
MKQSFSTDAKYAGKRKQTRRERFLLAAKGKGGQIYFSNTFFQPRLAVWQMEGRLP